jgi:glycosyltransferase involved in cell wall biosynthesis
MFSIYILTHNEEIDIAACIESAQLSDDVIVVDSYSSDRTVEIARRYNVRVIQHEFESHGKQRTWMLRSVPTQHEWVGSDTEVVVPETPSCIGFCSFLFK